MSNGNLKPTLIKSERPRKPWGNFRFQSQNPEQFHVLRWDWKPWGLVRTRFLTSQLFLLSEKTISSNKNPSKPPISSAPPKAPEETHFGVVIHDRGRCGPPHRLSLNSGGLLLLDVLVYCCVCLLWRSWLTVLSRSHLLCQKCVFMRHEHLCKLQTSL